MFSIIIATTLFLSAMSASLPIGMNNMRKRSYNALSFLANSAKSTLITFDDITNSTDTPGFEIPNGYNGLNWGNAQVLDGDTFFNPSTGYKAGLVSHPYLAFDPWAGDISISSVNGSTFAINSFYSCAVWYDGYVTLNITGSKSGAVLYTKSLLLSMANKTLIELNWSNIDSVLLSSTCEICCNDKHFTMDNLSVTF